MNGHNHRGAYGYKKGIHYVVKGMVDTEETVYAIIRFSKIGLKCVERVAKMI